MTSHRSRGIAALLLAAAAGCSSGGPSPSSGPASSLEPSLDPGASGQRPLPTLSIPPSPGIVGPVPDSVLTAVREDLARRLGVDVTGATVVEAQAVTFSDGSLDCPEPGIGYTQALVEGYRVVVELDGRQYDYRIPGRGAPKLCEQLAPGRG